MAKSKPVRNVDTTKSVPINAMFKHIAGYKKRKEETREAQHAAKKKADEARRALAKRKSRKTPDHSLAVAVASMAFYQIFSNWVANLGYSKLLLKARVATSQKRSMILSNLAVKTLKSGWPAPIVILRRT